jgi:hypothetical protein
MARAWIGNLGEHLKQGKGSSHQKDLLVSDLTLPPLPSPSLLAKVNLQTALPCPPDKEHSSSKDEVEILYILKKNVYGRTTMPDQASPGYFP